MKLMVNGTQFTDAAVTNWKHGFQLRLLEYTLSLQHNTTLGNEPTTPKQTMAFFLQHGEKREVKHRNTIQKTRDKSSGSAVKRTTLKTKRIKTVIGGERPTAFRVR